LKISDWLTVGGVSNAHAVMLSEALAKSKHLVIVAETHITSLIVIQARSFDYGFAFAQDDELRSNIVPSPSGKATIRNKSRQGW
jgi:hypothetical protein